MVVAKSPEYVTTNFGTVTMNPEGLIVIFSQFYLKLNNLFVR